MNTLKTLPLQVTVGEARSTLREALNTRGITIFSEMDHTRSAFNDLLTLPASVVFLFAPRMPLWRVLRAAPALGADLPLKICLWQDNEMHNWLSATDMAALLTARGVDNLREHEDILLLSALMDELTTLINR